MKTVTKQGWQWALALCLAAGAGSTQAAISGGTSVAGSSYQAGELFLNVWDELAQTSYELDLGTTVTSMIASQNADQVWNFDSAFVNWAALTTDTLTFNVAGANTYYPAGLTAAQSRSLTSWGVMLSTRTGYDNHIVSNTNNVIAMANTVANRTMQINSFAGDPYNYAANLSAVTAAGQQGYFAPSLGWGPGEGIANFVGSATVRNGGTDQTLDLAFIHSPGGTLAGGTQMIVDYLNGYLSLDVAAATLTWHTNSVATVPVPGAVWMFLSGLLATLRFQKRKSFSLA